MDQIIWILIAIHTTGGVRDRVITMNAYRTNAACLEQIDAQNKGGNAGLDDPKHWQWNCIRSYLLDSGFIGPPPP
jgi:hypothetical protein